MNRIPVIIPARNEANEIGQTLRALGQQSEQLEPIVIANGCEDDTVGIAKAAGATVLESIEGKMPALQVGLKYLGERALKSLLILDADTRPRSRRWAETMLQAVNIDASVPAIAWGLVRYHKEDAKFSAGVRTLRNAQIQFSDRHKRNPRRVTGCNTVVRLANRQVLTDILELDNFWPGEDVATYDVVMSNGGVRSVVFSHDGMVDTDALRWPTIWNRLRVGRTVIREIMHESYVMERPTGSTPYNSSERRAAGVLDVSSLPSRN